MGEEAPPVAEIIPSITTNGLHYKFPDGSSGLTNVNLDLPAGSRTLLIGGELLCSGIVYL
jgi:CCR4-NOT complex subunit CAF16